MAPLDSNVLKLAPDVGTPAFRSAPHNIEAEQALLGAILVNNDAFYRVSDFLEPKHFFEPIHQTIFETAGSLIRMGKIATPVTLKTFLPAETDIGGMTVGQYLARLAAEATTIINAQDYGRTVYELALRRDLIRIGEDMVNVAFDAPVDFAPRARMPNAGCTNWPSPAAMTADSSVLPRPSPSPSTWRPKRFSATANSRALRPACATSTPRWAACSPPI
jgi:replicative DNA helicase